MRRRTFLKTLIGAPLAAVAAPLAIPQMTDTQRQFAYWQTTPCELIALSPRVYWSVPNDPESWSC